MVTYTRDYMIKKLGTRIVSRIWGNNTQVIVFNGGDKR